MLYKKTYVVIPVYNEESVIQDVIGEIQKAGYENIIMVDDGSYDNTQQKAKGVGVISLRHKLNRGKGAAAKTGIEAAKILGADIIVTMDGDGQHDPQDIQKLVDPISRKECDVVLGSRLLDPEGMPWYKILHNKIGNIITWYLYGLLVTDSQSGLRAYSQKAAEYIDTSGDRYEYDSEVIREIHRHKLKYKEIPIQVRYTKYSMGKIQKQGLINGFKTVYKMLWKLIH